MLELRSVSYRYPGAKQPALGGVDLSIRTGEITALIGNNSSGKSTLARIAAGLLAPSSGEVLIDGKPLTGDWNGVGILFQNPDEQFIKGNVEAELAWGLENLQIPAALIARRVDEALTQFGLEGKAQSPPDALSDGEKQLVALASVMAMKPNFLILDEPTAFLDDAWTARISDAVTSEESTTGVLWIATRPARVVRAGRVITIRNGVIGGAAALDAD